MSMVTSTSLLTESERTLLNSLGNSDAKASFLRKLLARRQQAPSTPKTYADRQAQWNETNLAKKNAANAKLRDVGKIPDIANPEERENAKWDLRYYIERYHPEKVYLGWCGDHLTLLTECQHAIIETSQVAVAMTRGSGKALSLETPLPTPSGWTTMGEVLPGDELISDTGVPCRVVAKSEVIESPEAYLVKFSNGEQIKACADHQWVTTAKVVQPGIGKRTAVVARTDVRTTRQLFETQRYGKRRDTNHTVQLCPGFYLRAKRYDIDPYVLGCWLGDGHSAANRLTCEVDDWKHYERQFSTTESYGECKEHRPGVLTVTIGTGSSVSTARQREINETRRLMKWGFDVREVVDRFGCDESTASHLRSGELRHSRNSLCVRLREIGVLNNKHIPVNYLRGSRAQRLALLQGLMDTDGWTGTGGKCEFSVCHERLASDALELIRSLGIRAAMHESDATLNGKKVGRRWRISFTTDMDTPVFRLPRKRNRLPVGDLKLAAIRQRVSITGIERIPPEPMQCVQVDGQSKMYLAGRAMIPTHNSTLMRLAVEWAVVNGHRKWPMLINAEMDLFKKQIRAFRSTFKNKTLLAADYPETVWVYRQMSTTQAASNMTCLGEPMEMIVSTEEIVTPTNYMSRELGTDGRVICGGGITGSVRGAQYTLPGGQIIRPDCVLLDDFQTRESAKSSKQVTDRKEIVAADVMGCAGPDVPMSALLACTVIVKDDAADQILGPEHPEWRTIRCAWIKKWPINMQLWHEYGALLRRLKSNETDLSEANEFYERNRRPHGPFCRTPGMDCGAEVYWEARVGNHIVPKAISSLQTAMSWWLMNPDAFMSEAQNDPIDPHEPEDIIYCTREEILAKIAPLERYEVPDDATELTAFVDVQGECFIYGAMAICPGFRRYVVDYGIWPDQKRTYWTRANLGAKLSDYWDSPKVAWLQGMIRVTTLLSELPFHKTNGQPMNLTLGLMDSADGDVVDLVFEFCRQLGGGLWFPFKGWAGGTNELNHRSEQKSWQKRHTDWGPHWNRATDHDRGFDRITADVDFYKSNVHIGIRTPEGDEGSLQFFDDDHQLLADHLRAESPKPWSKNGREFTHWEARPNKPDNDLFDCLSGCSVAASIRKIDPPGMSGFRRSQKRKGGRRIGRKVFDRARGR